MVKELEGYSEDFDITSLITPLLILVMLMGLIPITQQAQAQTQALQAQAYIGNEDPRTVNVTNKLSWINLVYAYPYQPWFSAYFINDGPSAVKIGINSPDDMFTIKSKETITVTRSGAKERIKTIFFLCAPGLKTTLRITGVY